MGLKNKKNNTDFWMSLDGSETFILLTTWVKTIYKTSFFKSF